RPCSLPWHGQDARATETYFGRAEGLGPLDGRFGATVGPFPDDDPEDELPPDPSTRKTSCTLVSPASTRDSAASCRYFCRCLRKSALSWLIVPPPTITLRTSSSTMKVSYTPTRPTNRMSWQNSQTSGLPF